MHARRLVAAQERIGERANSGGGARLNSADSNA